MDNLTLLFSDVADALGIESAAIVEKDHYIVELLRLLKPLTFDTHQLVFAGELHWQNRALCLTECRKT